MKVTVGCVISVFAHTVLALMMLKCICVHAHLGIHHESVGGSVVFLGPGSFNMGVSRGCSLSGVLAAREVCFSC